MRRARCLARGIDQPLLRHRQAEIDQQVVRVVLGAGDFNGDVRRFAGDGGLDALLESAVAKLDQRILIQTQVRNIALFGRCYQ